MRTNRRISKHEKLYERDRELISNRVSEKNANIDDVCVRTGYRACFRSKSTIARRASAVRSTRQVHNAPELLFHYIANYVTRNDTYLYARPKSLAATRRLFPRRHAINGVRFFFNFRKNQSSPRLARLKCLTNRMTVSFRFLVDLDTVIINNYRIRIALWLRCRRRLVT